MGRWAQRKRAGGGGESLNYITNVHSVPGIDTLQVTYHAPVDPDALDPAAFQSIPSASFGQGKAPNSETQVEIFYGDDISADTTLDYDGTTPGLLTPQTVPFT